METRARSQMAAASTMARPQSQEALTLPTHRDTRVFAHVRTKAQSAKERENMERQTEVFLNWCKPGVTETENC